MSRALFVAVLFAWAVFLWSTCPFAQVFTETVTAATSTPVTYAGTCYANSRDALHGFELDYPDSSGVELLSATLNLDRVDYVTAYTAQQTLTATATVYDLSQTQSGSFHFLPCASGMVPIAPPHTRAMSQDSTFIIALGFVLGCVGFLFGKWRH